MKRWKVLLTVVALLPCVSLAQQLPALSDAGMQMNSAPSFGTAKLEQDELRTGNGSNAYRWEGDGWYGGNFTRAWIKSEGLVDTDSGAIEEAELQGLYSRAISPFFDLQAGARYNFEPGPSRGWLTLGTEGLAPMFWEIGAFAFLSDAGHAAARFEGHYDLLITQRLILQPQFEVNGYDKSDPRAGMGAGLSDLDTGLRLRYEIRRQFAPYIGIAYDKKYGQTASFVRDAGDRVEDLRFVAGIRVGY